MLMGKSEKCWRLYSLYGKISSIFIGDTGDAENISPILEVKKCDFFGDSKLFRLQWLQDSEKYHGPGRRTYCTWYLCQWSASES